MRKGPPLATASDLSRKRRGEEGTSRLHRLRPLRSERDLPAAALSELFRKEVVRLSKAGKSRVYHSFFGRIAWRGASLASGEGRILPSLRSTLLEKEGEARHTTAKRRGEEQRNGSLGRTIEDEGLVGRVGGLVCGEIGGFMGRAGLFPILRESLVDKRIDRVNVMGDLARIRTDPVLNSSRPNTRDEVLSHRGTSSPMFGFPVPTMLIHRSLSIVERQWRRDD